MIKISFVGDIMCEKPLQNYSQNYDKNGYEKVFMKTRNLFNESDYVVGNLETVFAGEEAGYTNHIYCFNTPDAFAHALAGSGVDMVTTATNHSLDRGCDGLKRTIDVLEKCGIEYTGTQQNVSDSKYLIKEIGGVRMAFLSYTYGTNTHETNIFLTKDQEYCLNLIKAQSYRLQKVEGQTKQNVYVRKLKKVLFGGISPENRMRINKFLHRKYNVPRIDILTAEDRQEIYYEKLKQEVMNAKQDAEIVFLCAHMGGQFNDSPGEFSKHIAGYCSELGVDYVIGNHPHVVQKHEKLGRTNVFYCLGNYSISPSSVYLLHELKPQYSICLHVYIENENKNTRCSFSILKIVEDKKGQLTVWPVDELDKTLNLNEKKVLKEDVTFIYNRFTQSNLQKIPLLREYKLEKTNFRVGDNINEEQ